MRIINEPKPGMLIRTDHDTIMPMYDLIVEYHEVTQVVTVCNRGSVHYCPIVINSEIKWPNEPDTAWRRVFAEEVTPAKKTSFVYMDPNTGEVFFKRDLYGHDAVHVATVTREKQPDGTWKIIDEDKKPEHPPTKYPWTDPSIPDWVEWIATDSNKYIGGYEAQVVEQ